MCIHIVTQSHTSTTSRSGEKGKDLRWINAQLVVSQFLFSTTAYMPIIILAQSHTSTTRISAQSFYFRGQLACVLLLRPSHT
jgi:hypothetical protein